MMGSVIVFVAPGQGSQTPGFLEPWLADSEARELLANWSEVIGVDLIAHGTVSDAETIRDTAIAQPLIVAAGLLTARALRAAGVEIGATAGHSVGEITAAAIAGVLSEEDALAFVRTRALAMANAAAATPTGMSAVIGGAEDAVIEHISSFGLEPANYNGGGQIVAAGALDALADLAAAPPAATRVIPLLVAGAFHTRYMASAVETLRAAAAEVTASAPETTLWTNRDGSVVDDGRRALDLLVEQVASPVRWDLCMSSFADRGVTGIIELSPAGTLAGLAKRALRGTPTVAVKTPDDLAAAAALLTGDAA
jgi:[acyl-carrier-protein] S-malonyltransferase